MPLKAFFNFRKFYYNFIELCRVITSPKPESGFLVSVEKVILKFCADFTLKVRDQLESNSSLVIYFGLRNPPAAGLSFPIVTQYHVSWAGEVLSTFQVQILGKSHSQSLSHPQSWLLLLLLLFFCAALGL